MSTSLAASAARGSLVTLAGQVVRIGTQFASIAVLARLLTSVDYGYLALVLAIVGVAELLRDFGLSAAAVQARELSPQQQTNLFWLNTAIGAAASLLVLACSPLVALVYGEPALTAITMALSPIFLLNGMTTQFRARLTRGMRFSRLSLADVAPQVVAFAVAIAVAVSRGDYWALVAQQMVVSVVGLIAAASLSGWWPGLPSRGAPVVTQIRFGRRLLTTNLMTYGVNNAQTLMLGAVWGVGVVGYFSRAYQLMALPLTQIVAPLTRVALPVLSQVHSEPARYARIVARAQLLGLYATGPLFLLCCILAEPLIGIALGGRWSDSVAIFSVLALGGAFRAMSQLAYWIFLSSDNTASQLRFNAAAYPVMVALMAAGLPWQGVGVAVGHTVGYALYWPLSLLAACRAAGMAFRPLAVTALRVGATVGLGVVAVSWAVTRIGWGDVTTVAVAVLAAGGYVAAAIAVLPSARADFATLADFARGARRP